MTKLDIALAWADDITKAREVSRAQAANAGHGNVALLFDEPELAEVLAAEVRRLQAEVRDVDERLAGHDVALSACMSVLAQVRELADPHVEGLDYVILERIRAVLRVGQ